MISEVLTSGIYPCVVRWKSTDVSDENVASIFRIEVKLSNQLVILVLSPTGSLWPLREPMRTDDLSYSSLLFPMITGIPRKRIDLLATCCSPSSTLKTEAIRSFITPVDLQRTTQPYVLEDRILHNHRCDNLKSWAVPHLRRLVAGFPPRRPGFEPGSGHGGFVVDKVTLGQGSSETFGFPC
jgi:hypothetical protein